MAQPNILLIMTDQERYTPPDESPEVVALRRTQRPARERLRSAVFDLHRHDAGSSELNLAPPSIKLGSKSRSIPESSCLII